MIIFIGELKNFIVIGVTIIIFFDSHDCNKFINMFGSSEIAVIIIVNIVVDKIIIFSENLNFSFEAILVI